MRRDKLNLSIILFIICMCIFFAFIAGCSLDPGADAPGVEVPEETTPEEETEEEEEEEPTVIPPPENLLGTIALDNGKSAVMELDFAGVSANYLPGITPRTTVGVSGKVRYEGEDYVVGGLYDDETGALDIFAKNSSDQKFIFSGTYTPGTGFSGSVKLYDSDGTTELASGSVSTVETTDADKASIRIFTGSFGGDAYGTWNGTLTDSSFYGTWSGITPDGWRSGTFTMSRSGSSISNLTGSNGPVGGAGTLSGTLISGSWVGEEESSGSWTGAEVDADYDHHVPTATDNGAYLANIIWQALLNGDTLYRNAVNGDVISFGASYQNISASATDYDGDGNGAGSEHTWVFASYTDTQTGLTLSGELTREDQNANGTVWQLIIDSDVSDPGDSGGLTVTFTDTTFSDLFVDVEIDEDNETISGSAIWQLGGADVLSHVEAVFF